MDTPCKFFLAGGCSRMNCVNRHYHSQGNSINLLSQLKGHAKAVTGISLLAGDELYSGCEGGEVRIWESQKCTRVVSLGDNEVGCMISHGPMLFIGLKYSILISDTKTRAEQNLGVGTGKVHALAVSTDQLFAATQEHTIHVWKYDNTERIFKPGPSLVGHQGAVVSLAVGSMKLYSVSTDSTIKVWDLATLECLETLSGHSDAITSVLYRDSYLYSCSLDQTIKVWGDDGNGHFQVLYTHKEDKGALALMIMDDLESKAVLFCSLEDNTVRLYDLPLFRDRGRIFSVKEVKVLQSGPGGKFFTGDRAGDVKIWQFVRDTGN